MSTDLSTNSPAKLACSFSLGSDQLDVKVKIRNDGDADLFVLNRLWDTNHGRDVDDPEKVYRFVRNSDLRLLWGIAPLPRLKSTMFRNIPFATILRPHSSLDWDYSVKVPVSEYNVYFEAPKGGASVPSAVERVVVIVEFVEAQSGLTTTPTELGSAVKVSTPHATGSRKAVICTSGPIQLEALLRTDRFSRFNLPNEQPELLHLAP
jgi:hypothetical protein